MLPNSAIVQSVVDDLVAADAVQGKVIVDMSSSEPLATRALAASLAESGVSLVDAPVSGGVGGAVNGTLTIMVGGDDAAFEQVLPVLSELGKPIRTGVVGSGHAIKALNNLLSATHLLATSEAMEAGVAFGLDPEVMLAVFNTSSGRSGSTETKWPKFVLPGSYDSGFGLALMLKDMKIAVGLAESTKAPHELGSRAVELWSTAASELPARADHTEVARWVAAAGSEDRSDSAAPHPLKERTP
jgi:3-hydroxyisobutyrate dehydrogenase